MLNCKDVESVSFISLIEELSAYGSMWDHEEALCVSDKSRHVASPLSRVSMAMAEPGRRAGRSARTHVEISIDLDETVAGKHDSLTQQKITRAQRSERACYSSE